MNNNFTITPTAEAGSSATVRGIAGALTSMNTTYIFNSNPMTFDAAESYCNDMGGHLASWGSSQEQQDVENYFTTNMGFLLAGFHQFYWFGLRAQIWPEFSWVDMSTDVSEYDHWYAPCAAARHACHVLQRSSAAAPCLRRHLPILYGLHMRTPVLLYARGQALPASMPSEPNNLSGNELCAGGNYTEKLLDRYGWADTECARQSVFICELLRK